ncbi:MAG: glycosyltransferase [Patescibacteria group bacterium]|nr:glycosyltransferase [Patescibacteria group bacterium]
MKILEINKFFYRRGGAEHHFFDLCALLAQKGDTVVNFAMFDERNEGSPYQKYFVSNSEFGKFNWHTFLRPFKVIYSLEAKRKISKLIGLEKPDVAHLHLFYHHLSPSILVALKKAKIPMVMTVHDWKALCPNYSLFTAGQTCERCRGGHYWQAVNHRCLHRSCPQSVLGALEAYIHHAKKYYENYIDLLIAPSDFVRDKFLYWGWPKEKIVVLPHFLSPAIERATIPPALPAQDNFSFIGRLSPEKGIDELTDYWIKEKIQARLNVYGSGPLEQKLIAKVKANPEANILLRGQTDRSTVYDNIKSTTAVIVPSTGWETFGLTVIESFAKGIPVIVSHQGAPAELIKDSGAGVLFDWPKNNLKDALAEIKKPFYRERAIDYMSSHHLPDKYYATIKEVFTGLRSLIN